MKKLILILLFLNATASISQDLINDSLKIAFVSYKTGTAEIFLMNPDGSGVEQITDSKENNSFPYQIDNKTIGFTRTDSLNNQTRYKVDIITKKEERIIEKPVVNGAKWEAFSVDKRFVAFVRSNDYSDRELYIYDTVLKQEKKITDNTKEAYNAISVGFSWSKNGNKLVFMSGPDWFNQFIRVYDLEQDKVETVTQRGYMNSGIKWLNDNKTLIANLKIRNETLYEIYSVNSIDGKLTQLTKDINLHPDVSPDGEWIVFESQRHKNYGEAYIMKKDGTQQKRLTNNEDYNGRCIWFQL